MPPGVYERRGFYRSHKVTPRMAYEILVLLKAGWKRAAIAEKYDIHKSTVTRIKQRALRTDNV